MIYVLLKIDVSCRNLNGYPFILFNAYVYLCHMGISLTK